MPLVSFGSEFDSKFQESPDTTDISNGSDRRPDSLGETHSCIPRPSSRREFPCPRKRFQKPWGLEVEGILWLGGPTGQET